VTRDRWTAEDPEPGDFDADMADIDPDLVAFRDGYSSTTFRVLVSVEDDDSRRLGRIAEARGKSPHDVIAELRRNADRPAA
jgi:hypothetical protein